ncbi:unnamed protein product [Paramecium sonneborni]|uniref:Uncharacterized protein n=1 Tax=Paramecium sonneborni TaxID=65129 RepID=A0A8S1RF53_9CILI|nr:unnamed protein product [Paramecium sonneborni]
MQQQGQQINQSINKNNILIRLEQMNKYYEKDQEFYLVSRDILFNQISSEECRSI